MNFFFNYSEIARLFLSGALNHCNFFRKFLIILLTNGMSHAILISLTIIIIIFEREIDVKTQQTTRCH